MSITSSHTIIHQIFTLQNFPCTDTICLKSLLSGNPLHIKVNKGFTNSKHILVIDTSSNHCNRENLGAFLALCTRPRNRALKVGGHISLKDWIPLFLLCQYSRLAKVHVLSCMLGRVACLHDWAGTRGFILYFFTIVPAVISMLLICK